MLSVGIDVGTSTSQLIFSRLRLENQAGYFAVPSVSIVEKEVIYESPVYETPLLDESLIDGDALALLLEREYAAAGVELSQVETGAVIITGESARKENARMVLERLSRFAGDFVVSTAGPDLESRIAGQGSGAQRFSREEGETVLNLDIGGGTSNAALFDDGECVACGCLDIGGRQVRLDRDGRIRYVSPSAARIAASLGLTLRGGERAEPGDLRRLCRGMVSLLEEMAGLAPASPLLEEIKTAGSGELLGLGRRPARWVCFSGGVGECIRQESGDPFRYGDIGVLLGEALRESRFFSELKVLEASEAIRATVIGAGSHTTSLSGSTVDYAETLLPIKNVPVLKLPEQEEALCWSGDVSGLRRKIQWFLGQSDADNLALAIRGKRDPDYGQLKTLADALSEAMDQALPAGAPLLLVIREDMAKALGQIMRRRLGDRRRVLSLDGIQAGADDFVDFGRPQMGGLVVPVVVKTLIFN